MTSSHKPQILVPDTRVFLRDAHALLPTSIRLAAQNGLDGSVEGMGDDQSRLISYTFSDASIGRDQHTIAPDAWVLDNFQRNPVFLWAHDQSAPPIGKVLNLRTLNGKLKGDVLYADAETYPFADMIFRMVKQGLLNATSAGWIPLDWKVSRDKARQGGVDFTSVELLEISQVPVPALPTALADARASGIDTRPMFEWAERMLDLGGFASIAKSELEILRQDSRMPNTALLKPAKPFAAPAKSAPGKSEPGKSAPGRSEPGRSAVTKSVRAAVKPLKRALYHVSWLASVLADLGYIQDSVAYETSYEGDESTVPADLLAAMQALGDTLIKMTIEEVTEMMAERAEDEPAETVVQSAATLPNRRAAITLLMRMDTGALCAINSAMVAHLRGQKVTIRTSDTATLMRSGKAISTANLEKLKTAHEHVRSAADVLEAMFDDNDNANPEDGGSDDVDDGDDEETRAARLRAAELKITQLEATLHRQVRQREAEALALKHKHNTYA